MQPTCIAHALQAFEIHLACMYCTCTVHVHLSHACGTCSGWTRRELSSDCLRNGVGVCERVAVRVGHARCTVLLSYCSRQAHTAHTALLCIVSNTKRQVSGRAKGGVSCRQLTQRVAVQDAPYGSRTAVVRQLYSKICM